MHGGFGRDSPYNNMAAIEVLGFFRIAGLESPQF